MPQELKLNLDAAEHERNIDANTYKTSDKKEIDRHDRNLYWPTLIIDTIQWFTFITMMKHTANILNPNKRLIISLLMGFAMFELSFIDDRERVEAIDIRCINCKK